MIPGITTTTRLPRLGKIRLGEKRTSKNGAEYPAATDHFVFDDDVPELARAYGENCRELYPVMLPHDDEEVWFPTSRSAYGKSGLYCRCSDGETATRVFVPSDAQSVAYLQSVGEVVKENEMFDMPCPGEDCPYMQSKKCKNMGRLRIILPNVPRFGVYEIVTSSYNGIVNVLNVARAVKGMIGRVAGVPFALKLEPIQVQPDGKAKTVYVLQLECRASLVQLASMGKKLQLGGGALALIDAPDDVPDDLFPHGGGALDAHLSGRALPPARPARSLDDVKARMAAPASQPAAPAPAPPAAPPPTAAPAPTPQAAGATAAPAAPATGPALPSGPAAAPAASPSSAVPTFNF